MQDEALIKTVDLIKNKYSVEGDIAEKYAEMALTALESHGGARTDYVSVVEVVDVVVKDWLENDGYF